MLVGTLFYKFHDGFGWNVGFFQCVNVGMFVNIRVMCALIQSRVGYWSECSF
jgi:hypothetical protein